MLIGDEHLKKMIIMEEASKGRINCPEKESAGSEGNLKVNIINFIPIKIEIFKILSKKH